MLILPRRIKSKLRYWRTGLGYGVHSPFAYHFITFVLREQLPYYDFERLAKMDVRMARRHARLLYRLTDYFRPQTVWVGGEYGDTARAIVAMAHPSARFVGSASEADMAVYASHRGMIVPARESTVAFEFDGGDWEQLKVQLPGGMTFANGRSGVAVCRHGLPRQDYRLRF